MNGSYYDHALQSHRRVTHTRMLNLPTYYRTCPCHTAPHTVLLFSGNLLVSESLENVIKIRSLLDEYRIRAERVRCP